MCHDCWDQAGRPTELPPTYERFAELVSDLYDFHSAGGPLHTVLDDWNLDGHIEPFPGLTSEDEYDQTDNTRYVYEICDEIAALLNGMPEAQRYSALAHREGFIEPDGARAFDRVMSEWAK